MIKYIYIFQSAGIITANMFEPPNSHFIIPYIDIIYIYNIVYLSTIIHKADQFVYLGGG